MAIIYSYPQGTPTLTDNVIGSQIDPTTEENKTVQFTIGSIATLIGGGGGGTGTVTTVSSTVAGNAFDVSVATATTTPALSFTWAGTAAQYITGQGNLATSLVIGTTSTTAMAGNTTTITSGQASAITANTAKVSDTGIPAILSDGIDPSLNTGILAEEVRALIGAGIGTLTGIGASNGINVAQPDVNSRTVSIDFTGGNNFIGKAPLASTIPVADDKFLFMVEDADPANTDAFKISASEIGLAQITVSVSAAQLNALQATDVTLISGVGGKYIKVLDASFYFDAGSSQYTFAESPTAEIGTRSFFIIPGNRLSGSADVVHSLDIQPGDIAAGTALVLKTSGSVTGSGNGTLQIKIRYQILDTSAF